MNQRMYIGPTVPGAVKQGTVFIGELPKELVSAAEAVPGIANLVVPVERATQATQALKEQGSVEYVSYSKVLDYLKGVRKNGI